MKGMGRTPLCSRAIALVPRAEADPKQSLWFLLGINNILIQVQAHLFRDYVRNGVGL